MRCVLGSDSSSWSVQPVTIESALSRPLQTPETCVKCGCQLDLMAAERACKQDALQKHYSQTQHDKWHDGLGSQPK